MESFSIACTTCQVRLRVRDASAIGQILTCPKCGSMVLVERPEDTVKPAERTAAAAVPEPPDVSSSPLVSHSEAPTAQDVPDSSDTVEDLSLYGAVPTEAEFAEPLAPPATQPPAADLDRPLLPTDAWTSAGTRRWRSWALAAVAVAVGIVLALSLFGLVISKLSSTSHAEPVAAKLAIERPSAAAPASGSAAVVDAAAADPAQPIAEQGDAPPAAVEAASDPLSSSDQDAGAARQELPDRHDAAAPDEDQATQDDDVPPGFSPRDDDAAMDSESLDKTLDKFEALLDDPPPDLSEDSPRDDEEVVSPITHEGGTALPRPTARPIDVAARLRDTIQAIEFSDTPLVEFLEFMSHYSTIPMTLHPESLIWLKISPSSRVSVKTTEKTVSEILSGALRPLGLGFAVLDNQIVVGRPSADGSLRRFTFDVADLVSSEQGAELSSLVVDLVATATWEKNGGRGRIAVVDAALVVEQRDEILFEVLFLLERLRVARGALPLSRFDSRLFQPTDCQRALTGRLSQPVSLNYIRPSSFTAIVDRLGQETKTHMLIDWRSLASVGWTQDTKIPFHVQAKPLREALSILLAPMDLSYRVVGDKLIQISTPMHIHSVVQLESYRVGEMLTELSVEQLTARLQAAVLSVHDGRTATLRLDPVSQCLFVAAAPPIHDTIVEILAGWNRDG